MSYLPTKQLDGLSMLPNLPLVGLSSRTGGSRRRIPVRELSLLSVGKLLKGVDSNMDSISDLKPSHTPRSQIKECWAAKFDEVEQLFEERKKTRRNAILANNADVVASDRVEDLQTFMDTMLMARGYALTQCNSLLTGYHNEPTRYQIASYDLNLIRCLNENNLAEFEHMLDFGLSPNPCDKDGDSMVHLACRYGKADFLNCMVKHGCDLLISDKRGRTPLHEACSSSNPNFEIVEMLLSADPGFLQVADGRGTTPHMLVPRPQVSRWAHFLDRVQGTYWPVRSNRRRLLAQSPLLAQVAPNSRPLRTPQNAMTLEFAALVAKGRICPEEASSMHDMSTSELGGSEEFDESIQFEEGELLQLVEMLPI